MYEIFGIITLFIFMIGFPATMVFLTWLTQKNKKTKQTYNVLEMRTTKSQRTKTKVCWRALW